MGRRCRVGRGCLLRTYVRGSAEVGPGRDRK